MDSKIITNFKFNSLQIHRLIIFLVYIFSITLCIILFKMIKQTVNNNSDINFILTSGALFATFGSAIVGLSLVFHSDFQKRIELNLNILYKEIYKQSSPWRRWPFLKRNSSVKLLNGKRDKMTGVLTNVSPLLNFGTYKRKFEMPTIFEDYFDLPIFNNFFILYKSKAQFYTDASRYNNISTDDIMTYECFYDTYLNLMKFRISRYGIHFGCGMIFSTLVIIFIDVFT